MLGLRGYMIGSGRYDRLDRGYARFAGYMIGFRRI